MIKLKLAAVVLAAALALLIHPRQAAADVKLASLFTDHMVLQRDMKVPVWGTAEPGEPVTVTLSQQKLGAAVGADGKLQVTVDLAHQKVGTFAGKDGKWLLRLAPLKAGFGPLEMTITGKNSITLKDILIGEVWLCSGQSNMEFTVSKAVKRFAGTLNEQEEIATAKWPQIREFTVRMSIQQTVQTAVAGKWQVCAPRDGPRFLGRRLLHGPQAAPGFEGAGRHHQYFVWRQHGPGLDQQGNARLGSGTQTGARFGPAESQ